MAVTNSGYIAESRLSLTLSSDYRSFSSSEPSSKYQKGQQPKVSGVNIEAMMQIYEIKLMISTT